PPDPPVEGAPHGPQDAEGRLHEVDDGEAELEVGKEPLVAGEGEVGVAAQLHVPAEVEDVRLLPSGPEPARPGGEHRASPDAEVLAGVSLEGGALERAAAEGRRILR